MLNLLRTEVRRLTARRAVRLVMVIALGIILIVEVRAFVVSDRNLAGARAKAAAERANVDRRLDDLPGVCETLKVKHEAPPDVDCNSEQGRRFARQVLGNDLPTEGQLFRDPRLPARTALPNGARAVVIAMAIIAFLVGATYVGAEWHAGTMQALLFWEPRRGRVLLAKAVALVAVAIVATAALQAVVYGMTYVTAATRGTTEGVTAGLQMSVLLLMLRGMIVVACTALLGFGVAGLARVTAASLGVAFVYFVILENLMRGLRPGWQRFLFSENVSAVLEKSWPVATAHRSVQDAFSGQVAVYRLSGVRGTVTLAVYLAVLLGVFYGVFSRRDVT
jgi:ABC-type transport system involved in multi-copper enzyme maturation permease subunit